MKEDQCLLQEIRTRLTDMTEDQKQKVLDILLGESSGVCEDVREAV